MHNPANGSGWAEREDRFSYFFRRDFWKFVFARIFGLFSGVRLLHLLFLSLTAFFMLCVSYVHFIESGPDSYKRFQRTNRAKEILPFGQAIHQEKQTVYGFFARFSSVCLLFLLPSAVESVWRCVRFSGVRASQSHCLGNPWTRRPGVFQKSY